MRTSRLEGSRGDRALPGLLLALTVITGLVDAVSVLALGRVFVANMTGNVVFLGFALAGAPGFSLAASAAALLGFLIGAAVEGKLVARGGDHRGRVLRNAVAVELALVLVALIVTVAAAVRVDSVAAVAVAALLALAMGVQNTAARRLAVPDLTTTVLTMTLTGIAADARRSPSGTLVRRTLSVATMFGGATIGALLVLRAEIVAALAAAVLLLGAVTLVAALQAQGTATWHTTGP